MQKEKTPEREVAQNKVCIVLSKGSLDMVNPAFMIGNTAATMGAVANRKIVDSRGSFCPGPIADITAWAARGGNETVEATKEKDCLRIVVRIFMKGR